MKGKEVRLRMKTAGEEGVHNRRGSLGQRGKETWAAHSVACRGSCCNGSQHEGASNLEPAVSGTC